MDDEIRSHAVRLQMLATRMLRLARSGHANHNLTSAQYSALSVLHERGPLPLGELARAERVSHPTMSRIISGLARMGAISRPFDPSDRRLRYVELTSEGLELYEQVAASRIEMMAAVISELAPAMRADLLDVIARVVRDVEARAAKD